MAERTGADPRRRSRAWAVHPKPQITFSDALAVVCYHLWSAALSSDSADHAALAKVPRALLDRLTQAACFPT